MFSLLELLCVHFHSPLFSFSAPSLPPPLLLYFLSFPPLPSSASPLRPHSPSLLLPSFPSHPFSLFPSSHPVCLPLVSLLLLTPHPLLLSPLLLYLLPSLLSLSLSLLHPLYGLPPDTHSLVAHLHLLASMGYPHSLHLLQLGVLHPAHLPPHLSQGHTGHRHQVG